MASINIGEALQNVSADFSTSLVDVFPFEFAFIMAMCGLIGSYVIMQNPKSMRVRVLCACANVAGVLGMITILLNISLV